MNSSFFKPFSYLTLIILGSTVFVSSFYIPAILDEFNTSEYDNNSFYSSSYLLNLDEFVWPVPNSKTITSYFGRRNAPTAGSSTYHSGIDIAASSGSKIIAILSGTVTYTGFSGAGGYTITITSDDEFVISYCHVSPVFLVTIGEYVSKGNIIGEVGPKNVYGVQNNPYKDSNGNPTNGATTGPHLHLTIKKDNQAVDPLDYLTY